MDDIIAFLTGQCSGQEFIQQARQNPDIAKWFQDILPPGAERLDIPYIPYRLLDLDHAEYQNAGSTHPFWKDIHTGSCLNCLTTQISFAEYFQKTHDFDSAGGQVDAYSFLFSVAKKRITDLSHHSRFSDEYSFYLDVCGEYLDGPEVCEYLDRIVLDIYMQPGTKANRIKQAKATAKSKFHIAGNKYPRWIQGPEWPMGKNSPMEYLSRKRDGERVVFTFRDVDTGEIREVEQFY